MAGIDSPGRRALRRGRVSVEGNAYLVTTVTDQRIPWFQVPEFARIVCRHAADPLNFRDAAVLCWVAMPDHVHLLLVCGATGLSGAMRRFKARSALALNREIGRSGRFWSPGFHDHGLRNPERLVDVARYIVANPLRAGLVERVGDYPYWDAAWLTGPRVL